MKAGMLEDQQVDLVFDIEAIPCSARAMNSNHLDDV